MEKARAVREATDVEYLRKRLTHIGERTTRAEIRAGADVRAGREKRHVLSRMIRARRRRIVSMVGCENQHVVVSELRQQARETVIELLEIAGVAFDVVERMVEHEAIISQ